MFLLPISTVNNRFYLVMHNTCFLSSYYGYIQTRKKRYKVTFSFEGGFLEPLTEFLLHFIGQNCIWPRQFAPCTRMASVISFPPSWEPAHAHWSSKCLSYEGQGSPQAFADTHLLLICCSVHLLLSQPYLESILETSPWPSECGLLYF